MAIEGIRAVLIGRLEDDFGRVSKKEETVSIGDR